MLSREPISNVDTAWLRMESPTNLMMITGVMTFAAPLGLARLRELIGQRFLAYRRFGQRPVDTGAGFVWPGFADGFADWGVSGGDEAQLTNAGNAAALPTVTLPPA